MTIKDLIETNKNIYNIHKYLTLFYKSFISPTLIRETSVLLFIYLLTPIKKSSRIADPNAQTTPIKYKKVTTIQTGKEK
jgi:hypothetical protein